MRFTTTLMLPGVVMVAACSMRSQDDDESAVMIHSEVSCPTCSIVFDSVVTLENAYFQNPATLIGRDSEGRIFFEDASDRLIKVYGNDGRFIRQIGRHGGGPGEYEVVRNIFVAYDGSVRILDGALGRLSAFSANGDFVSSTQVSVHGGFGMPGIFVPDDYLIVNAAETRDGASFALKLIDHSGNAIRLFDEIPSDLRKWWLAERILWRRDSGELLVGRPFTFTIDVFAPDLSKTSSVARVANWIPLAAPESAPSGGVYDKALTPRLTSIWEDEQGLLWLLMTVPSPAWRAGPPIDQVQLWTEERRSALMKRPRGETVLEVVDLERRRVLARAHFDSPIGYPLSRGYFAVPGEDSAHEPSLRISRVYLKYTERSIK